MARGLSPTGCAARSITRGNRRALCFSHGARRLPFKPEPGAARLDTMGERLPPEVHGLRRGQ